MNQLTIVVAQINLLVGDIEGNAQRIIEETEVAAKQYHADIVLFPELALTGYPPEDLLFRPAFYHRCHNALKKIISSINNTAIVIGYPEKLKNKNYNRAALIQNGAIKATYSKMDLPNYEVFDEKRYFTPGTKPCIFKMKDVNIAIMICEDLWKPALTQQAAKAGVQLILSLNASPFDRHKARARENLLSMRTTESNAAIIYANLIGGQDELVFDGGSMVVNQEGTRCQQAAYFKEDRMLVEFTIDDDKQISVIPKKIPLRLTEEENIYQTLVLGIRDYIAKNHFPGAIIGLSGGIDSALTLAITVDAIGCDRTLAFMMPSRYTAKMSMEDAKKQAGLLGVKYEIINIESIFKVFLKSLEPQFIGTQPDATEENLQARIRGTLLMALSNKKGHIVLTTGNKSEMAVGYATLYGDMAGGFSVLKDIPKTLVYRLANYRNSISPTIPDRVIMRPPSAELAEDQKDQDVLPPYPILDEILDRYIDLDQDPTTLHEAGLDKETVNKVIKMINRNEYKRRQAPIGIRVSQRAFGKDRRYPITSGYTKAIYRELWIGIKRG